MLAPQTKTLLGEGAKFRKNNGIQSRAVAQAQTAALTEDEGESKGDFNRQRTVGKRAR
jgi:hypothetical protein